MTTATITLSEIITAFYVPNLEKPGYMTFVRYASYREINEQIKTILLSFNPSDNKLEDYNAYSIAEWFSEAKYITEKDDGYTLDTLCIEGRLTVAVRHGSNEGYIIDIAHTNPQGKNSVFHPLSSIKYLSNEDEVWRIAKKLNDAIYEGGFC